MDKVELWMTYKCNLTRPWCYMKWHYGFECIREKCITNSEKVFCLFSFYGLLGVIRISFRMDLDYSTFSMLVNIYLFKLLGNVLIIFVLLYYCSYWPILTIYLSLFYTSPLTHFIKFYIVSKQVDPNESNVQNYY